MKTETNYPELLTPDEAAKKLKVSKRTFYRLVKTGVIVPIKFGSVKRYPADIREALKQTAKKNKKDMA